MSVVAAVAALLLLSGCDTTPASADDPREGRVTLTCSGCGLELGPCIYDWKVCAGPDLIVHISGDDHVTKDSKECAR